MDELDGAFAIIEWPEGNRQLVFFCYTRSSDDVPPVMDEYVFYYMEDRDDMRVGYSNGEWTIVEVG
jgi:hypothetical protein